ncbi:MAG: amidohydrolase family protein [Dehalococcoidia bacterium]
MTTTAFVDVTVVPMDSERLLEGQTVVVADGRIAAIGPVAAVAVPDGAAPIDGRGRFLMPGLADMHVHYNEPSFAALLLAHGVTTVRNMWGFPIHVEAREQIKRGEGFGPWIYTCGPIMDGNPPVWPASTVIETAEEAERSVAEQLEQGYDFLKVYGNLSRDAYDAIIAAGRKHGIRVVGHVPAHVGLQYALGAGQASIEHLNGYLQAIVRDGAPEATGMLTERMIQWTECADEANISEIVSATVEAGAWNCVTMIVSRKLAAARLAFDEERKRPELRYLSPQYITSWDPQNDFRQQGDINLDRAAVAFQRAGELRRLLVRALRDAGARLLLGSDTPNPFVIPGVAIHDELAMLVEAGLTPYEAIRAGTRDAAEFLGALDAFGTVAEGLRADLILTEGNPLDDVSNVAKRAGVMVRGRWLPAEELNAMLEQVATEAATGQSHHDHAP